MKPFWIISKLSNLFYCGIFLVLFLLDIIKKFLNKNVRSLSNLNNSDQKWYKIHQHYNIKSNSIPFFSFQSTNSKPKLQNRKMAKWQSGLEINIVPTRFSGWQILKHNCSPIFKNRILFMNLFLFKKAFPSFFMFFNVSAI